MKRMRDGSYTIKPKFKLPSHELLPDLLAARAEAHPDQVVIETRSSVGASRKITATSGRIHRLRPCRPRYRSG